MAGEHPERDGGAASWRVLLGLAAAIVIVVIGLIAYVTTGGHVIDTPPTFARPTPTPPGPITSLSELPHGGQGLSAVGRAVRLTQPAQVASVAGETVLWAETGDGRLILVVDDTTEDPFDVDSGQAILIEGEVRLFPGALEAEERWGLADEPALLDHVVYVQATAVELAGAEGG